METVMQPAPAPALTVAQVQFDRRYLRWVETGARMHAEACEGIWLDLAPDDPRIFIVHDMILQGYL